mmetsp:Transcript_87136/g.246750  ORF Transcript_87136/g.246750 Transcript_87136/m.246750 type:complete len:466 (+) Transcript_87136:55-1452(+)
MKVNARFIQIVLVAASRLLCYLSRAQLGTLLPTLSLEMGLSTADQGYLMSRYASGYIATQVLGGICADRLGGYPVLAAVMLASGMICLAAPSLALLGTVPFGSAFVLLGLVQGAAFPAGNVVCARWLLPSERALSSSLSAIGSATGTFLVSSGAPVIAERFGWQAVFLVSGVLCFAFSLVWLVLGASAPQHCYYVSQEELATLEDAAILPAAASKSADLTSPKSAGKNTTPVNFQSSSKKLPPAAFFMHASVGTLFLCHVAQNWQQCFNDWLPTFYAFRLGAARDVAGFHVGAIALAELPARAATAGLPALLNRLGYTDLQCRKLMSLTGFLIHLLVSFAVAALLLHDGASLLPFTVLLGCSKASAAMHAGGYFANYLDLSQNYSGILTGVGNTVATASGVFFPLFASWSLEFSRSGWLLLLASLAFMDLIAISAIPLFMSAECLDDYAASSVCCSTQNDDSKCV